MMYMDESKQPFKIYLKTVVRSSWHQQILMLYSALRNLCPNNVLPFGH